MKSNKGFTLIEMAVVLAIIAILAAVLTPIVTGYIDQARTTRATVDVSAISAAVLLHYRDTGRFPVYDTLAAVTAGTPSKNCMVSGTTATLVFTSAAWVTACGTPGILRNYLNLNSLGVVTGNPANGAIAYRGPYLDGLDANDPWGNPYVVTTAYLGSSTTNWAFTLSAGPDGIPETAPTQPHTGLLTTASDDITSLIR